MLGFVSKPNIYDMTLDDYPTIARIVANCEQLQAFIKAAPELQPDAQP